MKKMSRRRFLIGLGGATAAAALGGVGIYKTRYNPPLHESGSAHIGIGALRELQVKDPFDVCIIGSGPAGTVLGTTLAQQGIRTVILESGGDLSQQRDNREQALEVFKNSGTIDYPIRSTRVRALGGTSAIWTGRCSRLHPLDFQTNAYTPPGARWPIAYQDLQDYYARAEQTLRVRGGELSDYHAPRQDSLPLSSDLDLSGLKQILGKVDVTVDDSPTSTGKANTGGPIRVASDLLPEFVAQRSGLLVSGGTVTRLVTNRDRRIVGAEVKDLDNVSYNVPARIYIIACGGLESPRLLLLSRSETFPDGIGNHFDQVGRYFMEHPNISFRGMVEHNWDTLSPNYELGRSHQFYDQFKQQGLGSPLLVFIQSWVYRNDLSGWGANDLLKKAKDLAARLTKAELRIGATLEMQPTAQNRVTLATDVKDYFGNPVAELSLSFSEKDLKTMEQARSLIRKIYSDLNATEVTETDISWSHHHMGACRMGDNPETSVVDRNLRVHESPNLYVLSSAAYVTGGAAHPTLGIVALAHRLAGHLQEKLVLDDFGYRSYTARPENLLPI